MSAAPNTTLILLVGSNPLPNYLAACALRPKRIALVYTKATVEAKVRLRTTLIEALGKEIELVESFVKDATCATTVRRVLDPLFSGVPNELVLLNYTGGTKVMAVHARRSFSEANGLPPHASYLDDGGMDDQPQVRFDDGTFKALSEYQGIPFNLGAVLALHGLKLSSRSPTDPPPTAADSREILHKVLADIPLATALYCEHDRLKEFSTPSTATSEPFRADRYDLKLSQPVFPTDAQLNSHASSNAKKSWFRRWHKFIGGEWLEEWTGEQVRALASDLEIDCAHDLTVGVNAKREGAMASDPDMEIDIAVVRGHRTYFLSCTTDISKGLCKSKLFEIAVRARQLGGGLARAALVCLADDRVVHQLRHDVDDRPDAQEAIRVPGVADVRVFGLSDVRAWSDCDGKQPNRHTLKTWLES